VKKPSGARRLTGCAKAEARAEARWVDEMVAIAHRGLSEDAHRKAVAAAQRRFDQAGVRCHKRLRERLLEKLRAMLG